MQHHQTKILWVVLCFFISINELVADRDTLSINSVNQKAESDLNISTDSIQKFKTLAIQFANNSQAKESTEYIVKYISATSDMSFLNDHLFKKIENSTEYQDLKEKYSSKIDVIRIFYFCVGILGIFVFVLLNIKKSTDKVSNFIISLFVLFHSVFMLHLTLYVINIQYYFPHTLFVSTTFSFLYGPLLYFYCKRIIYNYKFKLVDALHLLPSIVLFIYIVPYYLMSRLEKFNVVFDQNDNLLPGAYTIILIKILSLTIYAYLLIKIYNKRRIELSASVNVNSDKRRHLWQRNIIAIHVTYTIAYIIYVVVLVEIINFPFLFHLQTIVMVGVVFYVAYISYVQPEIFMGKIKLVDPRDLFKYKKSGLTPSYSAELIDILLKLLNEDKIYKINDLNLEALSEKLETTRHNTSQIINEHFDMNFSELMNKYRIQEAVQILNEDEYNNLKIIQVAYEVGFNNKVTFNKSFKRYLSQTPSQYVKSLHM